MPTKYLRLFGYCLLGGGAVLALGSIDNLYRMSWKGATVRDILAPHLTSVPKAIDADDLNFTIQLSKDDAFKLWYFHASTNSFADAGSARFRAIGGMILMGIGMGVASYSACKTRKKKEAESGRGDGIAPVTPTTPPDMRVRIRRFQSDVGDRP